MKKIITVFIFCFLCGECFSQAGEWVWIHGDSIPDQPGDYGVQGVPSATNKPPAIYEACRWVDNNGNFWFFGGVGGWFNYSDLWKYDPLTNEWTWMKGPGQWNYDDTGYFGIQGISSPLNNPPARGYGMGSWVDNNGDLWMYSGQGAVTSSWDDLWKYTISTNEWTWMKGNANPFTPPVYGIQGVPSINNTPGPRSETTIYWKDSIGNFWLFGGYATYLLPTNLFNDLWKYNPFTNEWTWMKGDNILNQPGNYGTLGISNPNNKPGARMAYCKWKDINDNYWLFGGALDIPNNYFNDLWKYELSTNEWTWMNGSDTLNQFGNYGLKCYPAFSNYPNSRFESVSWTDNNGNFWLFGGMKQSFFVDSNYNDLWNFSPVTNKWTWVSGDSILNQDNLYGNIGIADSNNKPCARNGSITWFNSSNNSLYLMGGIIHKDYQRITNDLWKYTIDPNCPGITTIQENYFTNELHVFPNPTNTSLTISFQSSTKQIIELRIYNTLGKQIYFSKEEITEGKVEKEINGEKMSGGIYFLQVKTKKGNINSKVIVNH